MSVQRVITKVTMDCWSEPAGFALQVTTTYVESDLSGGRSVKDVQRYDRLTEDECRDVIDVLAQGALPGAFYGAQMAMFSAG